MSVFWEIFLCDVKSNIFDYFTTWAKEELAGSFLNIANEFAESNESHIQNG